MGVLATARFILAHPLAGRTPVASLGDWLRWQVTSRMRPAGQAVPFAGGTRLWVRRGMAGATGNIYCGLHELEDMAFSLHFLRGEEVFVDVGANVGSYTVLAAGAAGARVHAFEPVPATMRALADNVRLNRLEGRVTLHAVCVGAAAGEVVMTAGRDCTNHVAALGSAAGEATVVVPMETLDGALAGPTGLGGARPVLAKIDVEGFEHEVLEGAEETLASCRALIVEASRRRDEVLARLRLAGFEPVDYEPFARALRPLPGLNTRRGNTLFVRDRAEAAERLGSAARFAVKRTSI